MTTMITRVEYANADHTRTAVVTHPDSRWSVTFGDRATATLRTQYTRTMSQALDHARQWCDDAPLVP